MIDKNIDEFIRGQKERKTLEEFIPDAAQKACYITCTTHPYQFSHPSANQDKNNRITPIMFSGKLSGDGYVRSGNVKSDREYDMHSDAKLCPVRDFLALPMLNGKTVLENIMDDTAEARELLESSGKSADELRNQFMTVFKANDGNQITSTKIKQVYFPLENGNYHLLSILTPSPLVYELKNRITAINDDATEKRKLLKKGETAVQFREIYNLVNLKYGGDHPNNISQLNQKMMGLSKLLQSVPPTIETLRVRVPRKDFFAESLPVKDFKEQFESLHKIMSLPLGTSIPLEKQRKCLRHLIEEIVDSLVERLFVVREEMKDIPEGLKPEQKIWLNSDEKARLESNDGWENEIAHEIAGWIVRTYGRLFKERKVMLGDTELSAIENAVESIRELWK